MKLVLIKIKLLKVCRKEREHLYIADDEKRLIPMDLN